MQCLSSKIALPGAPVQARTMTARPAGRAQLVCKAGAKQNLALGIAGFLAASTVLAPMPASADLTATLLEKSQANKGLHDKQRLATSNANFQSSRTLQDGSCTFPNNFFGCGNRAVAGPVKYIQEDKDIECQGAAPGRCNSRVEAKDMPKAFAGSPSAF